MLKDKLKPLTPNSLLEVEEYIQDRFNETALGFASAGVNASDAYRAYTQGALAVLQEVINELRYLRKSKEENK